MTILEILAAWFLLSLTGALAPGPLSAAVIQNAAKRGRLFGMLPMVGHSIVEVGIVIVIIISVHSLVMTPFMIALIMGAGGLVVIFFGLLALREYRYSAEELEDTSDEQNTPPVTAASNHSGRIGQHSLPILSALVVRNRSLYRHCPRGRSSGGSRNYPRGWDPRLPDPYLN
ncbi:MAG: LysE family translocator [Candidatus Thorarchaeota archaeon]|nr:LysE family translocator [Candidatus Thorarchaeota archaeon]